MTITQASAVAGVRLRTVGDGVYVAAGGRPAGLSVAGNPITCVAAEHVTGAPVVRTPQGFPVGGTVGQLKAIYGAALRFRSRPATGITPNAGFVVHAGAGNLAFAVSPGAVTAKTVVYLIIGGPGVSPSTDCA